MNGNDPVTTVIAVGPAAAATALDVAATFATGAGLSADTSAKLAIIVEELVLNIVDHGQAEGTTLSITLAASATDVRISLCDAGLPFDPRAVEVPSAIPERGGGAGLALVAAWAVILDHDRSGGRNCLRLALPRD